VAVGEIAMGRRGEYTEGMGKRGDDFIMIPDFRNGVGCSTTRSIDKEM